MSHHGEPCTDGLISIGGFGTNNSGGFGSKPSFGSSTTLFGANTNNNNTAGTNTFGGFGTNNTAANTSTPFGGATNSGGGIFGANKPTTFGTTNPGAGSSLFGGGNTTAGGFGASNTGFGANAALGDPPGTASTPFNAFTEKETNTNITNSFQNILFQDPYKKWSAEELRLVDYAQGRRHGNATGGGAFGVGSNFGGFGNNTTNNAQTGSAFGATSNNTTGGGLFGNNTNNAATTNTGFGGGGFGANNQNNNAAGGGLFGNANKPGGMFGGNNATQNQQAGGGLFGGGTGGFGASTNNAFGSNNNANATGGGLFGNNANKTGGGFSFSNNNNANTNTTSTFGGGNTANAFGSNANNTGGGLFGSAPAANNQTAGSGLFGNNNQQQNAGTGFGNAFGSQQNQNQQSGGLFGNQQKPATGGLFGNTAANTNSGGGLFGANNTQQQQNSGGGLFGNTNNAAGGGGLFAANKPATGGSIFGAGNANQQPAAGSSLFGGGQQQQQNSGGGLFGTNNTQQKPGGLFGSSTNTGGGLFGSQNNQATGGGLFGNSMNQQQNQSTLGNSLLGSTQQNNAAPQGLTANLNDVSAYGSPSLFAGMNGNEVSNPGPLATPLNGSSKPRRSSILPMYKLAPATAASRFATPQKRGFGFSYSSYGTPGGSPASSISSTPSGGMGRSLLGSSTAGSLSKSISASNLRRSFNTEDSILTPGAFSASSNTRWYGSTGSKKLVINRDIRSDLFSTPQKDKADASSGPRKLSKRVSFDTSTVNANEEPSARAALPAPEGTPTSQSDESTPRQTRSSNGANGVQTPEMEQVKGNELAIVHEEDASVTPEVQVSLGFDNAPGDYWMQPTRTELQNMNRMQRQRVDNLTIGRENVGYIRFKVPVDISSIELDDLCGGIIQLEPRSATVYPVQAKKPPVGKGLNVPAEISLEQSWPRGGRDKRITSDPKRFNKHVERLKRIPDTTFESYDKDTGVWTFGVEHFTTYGLDDSDEESDDETMQSPPLDTPTRHKGLQAPNTSQGAGAARRSSVVKGLPGAFLESHELRQDDYANEQPFLGVSSADSAPNNVSLSMEDDIASGLGDGYDMSDDEDLTRSSLGLHPAAELDDISSEAGEDTRRGTPGGILRARMRAVKDSAGPVTLEVADGDDWMEMLRNTVSPVKRDRQLLRELNQSPSKSRDGDAVVGLDMRKSSIWGKGFLREDGSAGTMGAQTSMGKSRGFATSIDLMNSLFEKPKAARQMTSGPTPAKGFPQVGHSFPR